MPSLEARAAFNDAQRIAADLRDAHAQEYAVMERLKASPDAEAVTALKLELAKLRREWHNLADAYTKAMRRYTDAVERARRPDA